MIRLLFISSLLFFSCKESTPEAPESQIVEIPEEFVSFYEKFHNDSIFQLEHIVFPLSMKPDSGKWQKSDWKMHRSFDSQNGAYQREFDNFNGIIIEHIREKNNTFSMERRFSKFDGEYNLIYYTTVNQLENWGNRILTDSLNSLLVDSVEIEDQ